jgi:hypothetical protein
MDKHPLASPLKALSKMAGSKAPSLATIRAVLSAIAAKNAKSTKF